MAEDDRTFRTSTPQANRAETQGLGVGQRELDAQASPNREQHAIDPERTEPFDRSVDEASGEGGGGAGGEGRSFDAGEDGASGRGDLGEGTPPGVDVHKLGQEDNPQEDWGKAGDEGMTHSANHTRRGIKTEAERGQGAKTRAANKDIISRRG